MEREFISWLRQRLPPHPLLRLGPGDDAAVLRMAGVDECVVTVDMLTDHVDFELADVDPRRVGPKSLGGQSERPGGDGQQAAGRRGCRWPCPDKAAWSLAEALYEGMLPLAEQYDLAIAGGDTNSWDGPLAISITLLGRVTGRGPLCRGGARPGDRIVVTGSFGGSILGRHLDFEPRVGEALDAARPLRTARRHRRQRRPVARPGPYPRREPLRGGHQCRRDARGRRRPPAGREAGRRFHAAGSRLGRRRGF